MSTTLYNPNPTPLQRLLRLLGTERRDIGYVYLYAIVAGLLSLSLPLGIQAVTNLVSGGTVFSSVYLLIGLIIIGVIVSGVILIGQQIIVEILQQRLFVKAAFEYTYRLPRIQPEALEGSNPPELVNRFFDVLTIQKGLPKLLIDLTAAVVQILFGILLLTLYHPIFIVFGLTTIVVVIGLVMFLNDAALKSSLKESTYKYKLVAWLEDMAGRLTDLRQQSNSDDIMAHTDDYVAEYIKYRNIHFSVLKRFFYSALAFRTLITGGLLVIGTMLVVGREMTLGQFVAAQLVIVLVTSSVDKLIMNIDVVYDMMTAVEKIAVVTDLPLENEEVAA